MNSTRLFIATLILLLLPTVFQNSPAAPAAGGPSFVALAGHTVNGGRYCACGGDDCICDSGETPKTNSVKPPGDDKDLSGLPLGTPRHSRGGADLASGAMLLAIMLTLWLRLR